MIGKNRVLPRQTISHTPIITNFLEITHIGGGVILTTLAVEQIGRAHV